MPNRKTSVALIATSVLLLTLTGCAPDSPGATPSATPSRTAQAAPGLPPGLTPAELNALPAAEYDAVIPGLLSGPTTAKVQSSFSLIFDSALYTADFRTPVARITAKNFLNEPTIVVAIETRGPWSLILTPARQQLPSKAAKETPAPAQSAAWIPTERLKPVATLNRSIRISTSKQTLSIVDEHGTATKTFPVGVGTADTPTPTGTGYLQARYLDPAQGQDEHRIQLTSLHATAADEPYGGSDGGLIGIHFQSTARGAVSHGCVRLSADAIAAVDALPLGTGVSITD